MDVLDAVGTALPRTDARSATDPFTLAFEHAPLGMAVTRPDGHVLCANAALCQMLGYPVEAMVGSDLRRLVHADDSADDARSRALLLDGRLATDRRELRLRHSKGRTVPSRLTRIVATAADGAPLFVDQLQDLTEGQRADKEIVLLNNLLEQRIRRRTAELEESNEDLREFAYSLAHDVRGPLASIDGFSAQLQRALGDALEPRCEHYLRRIRAGVRTLAELTDGLLALADVSRSDLVRLPVDLSAIASALLDQRAADDPVRRVQVQVDATPPAQGDPRLLGQVLDHLLSNAWKFTRGREAARIRFGSEDSAGSVVYVVQDNGSGFAPEGADRLFTPFQRLHAAGEFDGHGIGLALARRIVARHGGRIWAESREGEGAVFRFTLGR